MSRPPPKIEQVIDSKTVGGYKVLPISVGGITYTLESVKKDDMTQIDCFIYAQDSVGKILWKTLYMNQELIPFLEMDVQEVYPVDFSLEGERIIIKHEHYSKDDGIYMIDTGSGELIESVQRKPTKKRSGVCDL